MAAPPLSASPHNQMPSRERHCEPPLVPSPPLPPSLLPPAALGAGELHTWSQFGDFFKSPVDAPMAGSETGVPLCRHTPSGSVPAMCSLGQDLGALCPMPAADSQGEAKVPSLTTIPFIHLGAVRGRGALLHVLEQQPAQRCPSMPCNDTVYGHKTELVSLLSPSPSSLQSLQLPLHNQAAGFPSQKLKCARSARRQLHFCCPFAMQDE